MNKYGGSLIVTLMIAWLFVCAVVIVVDPNAVAQTHDDLHPMDHGLADEKMASGDPEYVINDPAAMPRIADAVDLAKLSQDTPTTITGKVLDPEDRAIPRTVVMLTEADGTKHTTTSDSFGNFRFDKVLGGQQVMLSADASRHSFSDLPIGIAGETVVSWRATTK